MKINFDKESHTYKGLIEGKLVPLLNFSTFKEKYKRPFKPFMASARSAKSNGGNQLKIMKGWNQKGKIHRAYGTAMHDTLEGYIKYNVIPDDKYLEYFLMKFQRFLDHQGIKKDDLISEDIKGNEELRIGGIIDINGATVWDLKTGNFLKKKKGNLKKPFNFLPDNPAGSAALQLHFYKLFEGQWDKEKKVIYWDGRDFQIIDIEPFTDEQMELLINEIKNFYE